MTQAVTCSRPSFVVYDFLFVIFLLFSRRRLQACVKLNHFYSAQPLASLSAQTINVPVRVYIFHTRQCPDWPYPETGIKFMCILTSFKWQQLRPENTCWDLRGSRGPARNTKEFPRIKVANQQCWKTEDIAYSQALIKNTLGKKPGATRRSHNKE